MSEINLDELTRQIAAGYGISLSHQNALIAAALERDKLRRLVDLTEANRRGAVDHITLCQNEVVLLRSELTTLRAQREEAREALREIDAIAVSHKAGAAALMQKVARAVLAKPQPSGETK